jgi:hypothetical protein
VLVRWKTEKVPLNLIEVILAQGSTQAVTTAALAFLPFFCIGANHGI